MGEPSGITRGAANFLQALGQHGIGINVREDREALAHKISAALTSFHRNRAAGAGIGMNLQLDHLGRPASDRQPSAQTNRLFGVHGPALVFGSSRYCCGSMNSKDVREGIASCP